MSLPFSPSVWFPQRASISCTRLEKLGIFDWDIFLIIVKGLSPFPPFHDYQKYIPVKCTPRLSSLVPKTWRSCFLIAIYFALRIIPSSLLSYTSYYSPVGISSGWYIVRLVYRPALHHRRYQIGGNVNTDRKRLLWINDSIWEAEIKYKIFR